MAVERSEVIEYRVRGSRGDLYDVRFQRVGPSIQASCSCRAGESGLFCKHRNSLIEGEVGAIVSGDTGKLAMIGEYLSGTDAEAALKALSEAERQLLQAKALVSSRKRDVSALLGYWRYPDRKTVLGG